VRLERVARLQRRAQLGVVVDLAVVDDAAAAVGRVDRLVAAAAVDDGQPQVGVDGARRAVHAEVVGPAVVQAAAEMRGGAVEHAGVDRVLEVDASNAAHGWERPPGDEIDSPKRARRR